MIPSRDAGRRAAVKIRAIACVFSVLAGAVVGARAQQQDAAAIVAAARRLPGAETGAPKGPPALVIVGENHEDASDQALKLKVFKAAMRGDVVLGGEGVPRRSKEERIRGTNLDGSRGLFYGIDDEYAYALALVLKDDYFFQPLSPGAPQSLVSDLQAFENYNKGLLIFNLGLNRPLALAWAAVEADDLSADSSELRGRIDAAISGLGNQGAKNSSELKDAPFDEFSGGDDAWLDLLGRLTQALALQAASLPLRDQPADVQARSRLADPDRLAAAVVADHSLLDKYQLDYRNQFILRNIDEVAGVAAEKGLNAYIIVGAAHVEPLCASFGGRKTLRGLTIRCFGSWQQVPEGLR